METKELRITPAQLDRLADMIRRLGSPQSIQELAYQYIEQLHQEAVGAGEEE